MSNKQNDEIAETRHDSEIEKHYKPENFEWKEMRSWRVAIKPTTFSVIVNAVNAEEATLEAESQLEELTREQPNYLDIRWTVEEMLNVKGEQNA
jgi:hypothetical protein